MSISLTYDDTLSRVQVELSGLSEDAVRVERSINGLLWETVRGARNLVVDGGAASVDDYEFAAGVENQYRVLDVDDLEGAPVESDDITPAFEDCEVWLKSIRYPMLNQRVELYEYSDLERDGRASVLDVAGRSFPVGVTDVASGMRLELQFRVLTAEAARKLSLSIDVGDAFFLQIAPDGHPQLPPRSFYFVVPSSRVQRVDLGEKRRMVLQVAEVAPPGPEVVGSTLVWGTVRNLYGSWAQLRAANPTWGDLLATVGSPDDLVVL